LPEVRTGIDSLKQAIISGMSKEIGGNEKTAQEFATAVEEHYCKPLLQLFETLYYNPTEFDSAEAIYKRETENLQDKLVELYRQGERVRWRCWPFARSSIRSYPRSKNSSKTT